MACLAESTRPAPFELLLALFAFGLLAPLLAPPLRDLAFEPLLDLDFEDFDFEGLLDFAFVVDLLEEPRDDEVRDLV